VTVVVGVVDLGFGDAGKGLVVDALVCRLASKTVVRVNGGAQAGHNVVTKDGRHHCFCQVGAGSFTPGVRTVHGPEVVLHLGALVLEAAALARVGVHDILGRIDASDRCRVVTPWDQACARLRELARGDARHGSCGTGVGEVVRASIEQPTTVVRLGDLRAPSRARRVVVRARERARASFADLHLRLTCTAAAAERAVLTDDSIVERWLEQAHSIGGGVVADDDRLARVLGGGPVVIEGAQGVLLDQHYGFHPFTTWSSCTFAPMDDLVDHFLPGADVIHVGVVRTLPVRHGPGPFPTHEPALDRAITEAHNRYGPWQGAVRHGWPDAVMARYAADVVGRIDGVVVTHIDTWRRVSDSRVATTYEGLDRLAVPATLADQAALTSALLGATPQLDPWPHGERVDDGELWAGLHRAPLAASATGPGQEDLRWTGLLPRPARGWRYLSR